jgi:hypothetical protein
MIVLFLLLRFLWSQEILPLTMESLSAKSLPEIEDTLNIILTRQKDQSIFPKLSELVDSAFVLISILKTSAKKPLVHLKYKKALLEKFTEIHNLMITLSQDNKQVKSLGSIVSRSSHIKERKHYFLPTNQNCDRITHFKDMENLHG